MYIKLNVKLIHARYTPYMHDICTIYHYLSKMGRKHAISCILLPEMSKYLDFYMKIILNTGLYSDQDYIQDKLHVDVYIIQIKIIFKISYM